MCDLDEQSQHLGGGEARSKYTNNETVNASVSGIYSSIVPCRRWGCILTYLLAAQFLGQNASFCSQNDNKTRTPMFFLSNIIVNNY